MPSPSKKPQNNEEYINQQLRDTIYKKVTKGNHKYASPQKGDGTITKCIELFKQGASPEVLTQLEESLRGQEEYHGYYIKNFLPALKTEITNSEKLKPEKIKEIEGIINGIISKSSDKGNATEPFNKQSFSGEVAIAASSGSSARERDSLAKDIGGGGTSGTYKTLDFSAVNNSSYNVTYKVPPLDQVQTSKASKETSPNPIQLNGSFSQSCEDLENEDPSTTADAVEVPRSANTSKLSSGNDSDSGIDSPRKSEESLESPINSRRGSMSSILSSAGENNDPQKEDTGNQMQPEQTAEEEPKMQESGNSGGQANPDQVKEELSQVSLQQVTEARGEESKIPVSRTGMTDDDHTKDSVKSEEKKDRENATPIVQKLPVNEKKGEVKQPNNRNLHVALVAGCALSTIGCIVAGAMTSGLVGAGLLAMAAVFAMAAVAELHSNFLSSKLTSINVEPLVDDKELTACSRL